MNARRWNWFWRGVLAVLCAALFAGLLGTPLAQGLLDFLQRFGFKGRSGVPIAVGITALIFMTLPLAIYGGLGWLFPAWWTGDGETRCRRCGHILRGLSEPRCPECGERI